MQLLKESIGKSALSIDYSDSLYQNVYLHVCFFMNFLKIEHSGNDACIFQYNFIYLYIINSDIIGI